MRDMTPEQRETARQWVNEQRRLLAIRDGHDAPPELCYTLDDDEAIDLPLLPPPNATRPTP